MWTGWVIGILGIWTVIVPFLSFSPFGNAWNDWIVGAVCAILGFVMATARVGSWGWLTGIVGVWLFIAGFIPGLRLEAGLWWNDILCGIAFIVFGFAAAAMTRTTGEGVPSAGPPPTGV